MGVCNINVIKNSLTLYAAGSGSCVLIKNLNNTLRNSLLGSVSSTKTRISKILIPLDNSESAMNAVDYALLITKGLNAELAAIHVVRTEDALVASNQLIEDLETVTTGDSILQKVKEDAQKWFSAIRQKSSAYGIRLKTGLVISSTEIEDAIVDYAERENVDLIVIGGGKSGLKERLLGSITSHVATQTKRPILIVK